MSDTILEALHTFEGAERKLREQMQLATAQGQYETLLLLAGWAKTLAGLVAEAQTSKGGAPVVAPLSSEQNRRSTQRRPSKTYPRFFRNGHALIKVGWSKSEKAEYEHRAPTPVFEQVVTYIERFSKRHRFPMEEMLATIIMPDGAEIPNYQSYLVVAWLRQEELLVQHGRQGYSVKPGMQLAAEARKRFAELPDVGSRTLSQEEKAE